MQPARGRLHAFFRFIRGEKSLAGFTVFHSCFFLRGRLFLHHFFLKTGHRFFDLIGVKQRLCAADSILDAAIQGLRIDLDRLAFQGAADVEADAVADFVFLVGEGRIGSRDERRERDGKNNDGEQLLHRSFR